MRGAEPLTIGKTTNNGVFYLSSYPNMVDISNPRRALDISIVVYSILNGLRRMLGGSNGDFDLSKCYYNVSKMSEWPSKCNVLKLLDYALSELGLKQSKSLIREDKLVEELANIVLFLINNGLLIPIPHTAVRDSPVPIKFMNIDNDKSSFVILRPERTEDIASIKIAMILNKYFNQVLRSANIQNKPYHILRKIYSIIVSQLGLSNHHDLKNKILFFKTKYGELLRNMYNSKPLPINITNFEGRILPFILEVQPFSFKNHELDEIRSLIIYFFIKHGIEEDKARIIVDVIFEALRRWGVKSISEYQYLYLKNIFKQAIQGEKPLRVLLASPTGTGKTLVFILYSIILAILGKLSKEKREYKSLLIYPRKALATDQLHKFVTLIYLINKGLENKKKVLGRRILISLGIRDGDSPSIKEIGDPNKHVSLRGLSIIDNREEEIFHYYSRTEGYCIIIGDTKMCKEEAFVKDIKSSEIFTSDIIVTNHSMLNKIIIDGLIFGKNSSKIKDFISKLKLLVIDETHIFLERKLAFLLQSGLLKLYYFKGASLSYENNNTYIRTGLSNLDIILSSATITNRSLIRIKLDNKNIATMPSRNILGVFRFKTSIDENDLKEIKSIYSRLILEADEKNIEKIIYIDYYSTLGDLNLIRDFHGLYKIRSSAMIVPYPYKSSWTSLNESLISLLHLIHSYRRKNQVVASLVFVDSKETLRNVFRAFNVRQIVEAKDHIDRILLTLLEDKERIYAYNTISKVIMNHHEQPLYNVIWDLNNNSEYFSNFHNLSFYLGINNLKNLLKFRIPSNDKELKRIIKNWKLFSELYQEMNKIIKYSEIIVDNNVFKNLASENKDRINESLNVLKQYIDNNRNPLYFIIHHGSLDRRARKYVEGILKSKKYKFITPYIIFSTSTLEVGVDIPFISVVVQYGTDALSQEVQQRFGRSGRRKESMYVSLGILVLRNRGEDLSYMSDQEASNYIYSLKIPVVPRIIDEPVELLRHFTGVLFLKKEINEDIGYLKKELLNILDDIRDTYYNNSANKGSTLKYLKDILFNEWFNNTIENTIYASRISNEYPINYLLKILEGNDQLYDSIPGEFGQKIRSISEYVSKLNDNYSYYARKDRIDILLEIYAALAHILSYDIPKLLDEIIMKYIERNLNEDDIAHLNNILNNLLAKILHSLLLKFSRNILEIFRTKFKNIYSENEILRQLRLLYPPGYVDPLTYDKNLYKYIHFVKDKEFIKNKKFARNTSFNELIMRTRVLHTG